MNNQGEMVEVPATGLDGAALDWAVAKAVGQSLFLIKGDWADLLGFMQDGHVEPQHWCPSIDWAQGGPLIERHDVWLWGPTEVRSYWMSSVAKKGPIDAIGKTPLIAAMRAIVATELGKRVSIPARLAQKEA